MPTWHAAARQQLADIKAGRDARGMRAVPLVGPGLTWEWMTITRLSERTVGR